MLGQHLAEFQVSLGIGEFAHAIKKAVRKSLPNRGIDLLRARVLLDAGLHLLPELGVILLAAGKPNDAEWIGKLFFNKQMVERGDELAGGQIAAGAENHNRAGLDDAA